jgi:hypothetical protein
MEDLWYSLLATGYFAVTLWLACMWYLVVALLKPEWF